MAFKFTPTEIPDVVLIEVDTYGDHRGFFRETYKESAFAEGGFPWTFVQANFSKSKKDVVRGLHFQYEPAGIGKLISVTRGRILDVAADIRPGSPTYRNTQSFRLDGDTQVTLYVPAGCAHGFQALTDPADTSYRIDRRHDPAQDVTIAFDDPELAIVWPLPVTAMSPRDRQAPRLAALGAFPAGH